MPAVPIKSREQYIKAIEVLDRVGGTWQGVGQEEWFLLVTESQYQALVEARVITPQEVPNRLTPELREWALKQATDEEIGTGIQEVQQQGGAALGDVINRLKEKQVAQGRIQP